SRASGIPLMSALEPGHVRDQRGLGRGDRRANIGGSLSLSPGVQVPASVLLLDDVMTTGATADAAARILRSAGAEAIVVGVVARAW
ncbi:MAG: ComF family protein, partial [Coriobacteriia bacterium]|nr:ComF family protein [Coriobacteriia bacterium]